MFDKFKAIPMRVKIAVTILCATCTLLLVLLPPVAALALCTGVGVVWAIGTILKYTLDE
jgi:hypothetical protein